MAEGVAIICTQLEKLSDALETWRLPLQLALEVLTVAVEGFIGLVNTTEMPVVFRATYVLLSTGVADKTSGLVSSMEKEVTDKAVLMFPTASVTLILQLLWVPKSRVLKTIGLLSELALVVAELQSPP